MEVEGWTRRINTLKPVTNTDKYYPIFNANRYTQCPCISRLTEILLGRFKKYIFEIEIN